MQQQESPSSNSYASLLQSLTSSPYDPNILIKSLRAFIKFHQNPTKSSNQKKASTNNDAVEDSLGLASSSRGDTYSYQQLLLISRIHATNAPLTHLLLRTFKLLMRHVQWRRRVREDLMQWMRELLLNEVVRWDDCTSDNYDSSLGKRDSMHQDILIECANVILNICFEAYNVSLVVRSGKNEPIALPQGDAHSVHSSKTTGTSTTITSRPSSAKPKQNDTPYSIISLIIRILTLTQSYPHIQSAITGALQSICFIQEGKQAVIACDGVRILTEVLLESGSDSTKQQKIGSHRHLDAASARSIYNLRCRIIGALHNLSSDYYIALKMRDTGIIPTLIDVLKDEATESSVVDDNDEHSQQSPKFTLLTPTTTTSSSQQSALVASCAGCIQNLSREDKARQIIRENGGVEPLVALLFSKDTFVQKCAAAALLNIVGTEISDLPDHPMRKAFKEILSSAIAVGSIVDVFSGEDDLKNNRSKR